MHRHTHEGKNKKLTVIPDSSEHSAEYVFSPLKTNLGSISVTKDTTPVDHRSGQFGEKHTF